VIATSAASGVGIAELSEELLRAVERAAQPTEDQADSEAQPLVEHMVFRPAARSGFTVQRLSPGSFTVKGAGIERLLARFDVENEDAMAYLEGRLQRIGVLQALKESGFKAGDEIEIAGVVFELDQHSPS
jgi:GTP-binding protein